MKISKTDIAIAALIVIAATITVAAFVYAPGNSKSVSTPVYTPASAGHDITAFAASKGVTLAIKWCKGPRNGYYGCAAIATAAGRSATCVGVIFKSRPVHVLQATKIDPRYCA